MASTPKRRTPAKKTEETEVVEKAEVVESDEQPVFVDELPTAQRGQGGTGRWEKLLAPLREEPKRWARIPGDHNASVASMIRSGKAKGIDANEFEVATRTKVDGLPELPAKRAYIYARYIGE